MKVGIIGILILVAVNGYTQNFRDQNIFATTSASGKTAYYINQYLKVSSKSEVSADPIFSHIDRLERKRSSFSNDKDFLHYVFFKTHQRLLKHYTAYCSFQLLIEKGTYNCLTGTALYALLLDRLSIDYKIVETNYHIFLLAQTAQGEVLFEATDPLSGYVDSKPEIETRISEYKKMALGDNKNYYRYQFNLYNEVNLDGLLGLMYYNLSVNAYNQHELSASINYLDLAAKLYQSPRIEEFSKLIFITLREGKFDSTEKEICLKKIQQLRTTMFTLASASNF